MHRTNHSIPGSTPEFERKAEAHERRHADRGARGRLLLDHAAALLRNCDGVISTRVGCTGEEQRRVAEETIRDVDASGHWPGKVVTEISEAGPFWAAEAEDQDWFQRYPQGCAPPFPRLVAEAARR